MLPAFMWLLIQCMLESVSKTYIMLEQDLKYDPVTIINPMSLQPDDTSLLSYVNHLAI